MCLTKHLATVILLLTLNGCTVFGMIADGAAENKVEKHRPVMEQGSSKERISTLSQIGLEADIAIVKKIKDVLTPEQNKPKVRCTMENGLRICYEEGAEGY
jgi:Spy/CpxP family protein refolding chaperone